MHLQYVDNFAALSTDRAKANHAKEKVRRRMKEKHLDMDVQEDAKDRVELLGFSISSEEACISIKSARAWRLREALLHAGRLRKLSGMALEVLVGHATFCFLVR